jgi:hypothetical protein
MRGGILNAMHMETVAKEEEAQKEVEAAEEKSREGSAKKGKISYKKKEREEDRELAAKAAGAGVKKVS